MRWPTCLAPVYSEWDDWLVCLLYILPKCLVCKPVFYTFVKETDRLAHLFYYLNRKLVQPSSCRFCTGVFIYRINVWRLSWLVFTWWLSSLSTLYSVWDETLACLLYICLDDGLACLFFILNGMVFRLFLYILYDITYYLVSCTHHWPSSCILCMGRLLSLSTLHLRGWLSSLSHIYLEWVSSLPPMRLILDDYPASLSLCIFSYPVSGRDHYRFIYYLFCCSC